MSAIAGSEFLQAGVLVALVVACALPLSGYLVDVMEGRPLLIRRALGLLERSACRLVGAREDDAFTAAQRALVLPPAMAAALPGELAAQYGMTGAELYAIVREYITSRGYGENYVHGLGHGVGLEIHEMPNINKRGTDVVLEPGMTFSIEPGIYIPGKGGVRIEDTVVLTDDGAKVLCGVKKQLMEIV